MASPYQQQAFQRKLIYIGLILVLFTVAWGWRRYAVDVQARELAIWEQSRGEVELSGAVVRLGLIGSRGVATCALWMAALEKQKMNQWNELEVLVRALTKLQPHFITPWLFQSWNLAYNVSVESDRVSDKYFYVTRGIDLLARGERQNLDNPDLRWSIGFYTQHKVCQSDETNTMRSLFELSLIPPNDRDPERFRRRTPQGEEFNGVEFARFCRKYPQLIRRLHSGMHRETRTEYERQFRCERLEDVIQFLADNQHLPGLYQDVASPPGQSWQARQDRPLEVADRFPQLPPPHLPPPPQRLFDPEALTSESQLTAGEENADRVDAFAVAQSWYCYAQEPLPDPGELPGSNKEITDRAHQRLPQHMTTLIFRNFPAQAQRHVAERLQEEGWFDDQDWEITGWFQDNTDQFPDGTPARVGGGRNWSGEAWERARDRWRAHGEANHLLFSDFAQQVNMLEQARRFRAKYHLRPEDGLPSLREARLDPETREEYWAAQFLREYDTYRGLTNFPHHYHRALVEAKRETVAARKLVFEGEELNREGKRPAALKKFEEAIPLWRDKVLRLNKEYRRDTYVQEKMVEIQWKYQMLVDRVHGKALRARMAQVNRLVPLAPARLDLFTQPIFEGPFDITDEEGQPYISLESRRSGMKQLELTYGGGKQQPAGRLGAGSEAGSRP